MEKIYTARQICTEKKMYWITSYKTVLEYMNKYEDILKPIRIGENDSSTRYFVKESNLKEFVRMFESSRLS